MAKFLVSADEYSNEWYEWEADTMEQAVVEFVTDHGSDIGAQILAVTADSYRTFEVGVALREV